MSRINFCVDGHEITAIPGQTVLEAAHTAGVYIPHLCHHPILSHAGECKLCVVEVEGKEGVFTSCTLVATEGMRVVSKIMQSRVLCEDAAVKP